VFNTEAHPFRIRKRDPLDVWRAWEREHGTLPWYPPHMDRVKPTETLGMQERRLKGRVRADARDMYSEETDGGAVDDEGLPFDTRRGPLGLPRIPRGNRMLAFGPLPANVLYGDGAQEEIARQQQRERDELTRRQQQQQQQPPQQQRPREQQPQWPPPTPPAVPQQPSAPPYAKRYRSAYQVAKKNSKR